MTDPKKPLDEADWPLAVGDMAAPEVDEEPPKPGPPRQRGDVVIPLSPGQIIGGFAVLAGLIIMARRRRRKQD
ncbi:MAG: hypothetical protein HYX54_08645 [Chloroflexi bacterium]|nr:hypothetical protein [Chloroflexota bacterium]